jgi:hypothetical protein
MKKPSLDMIFSRSDDVVAREIDGALIIVPLTAGVGDMEDDLFSLNETGTEIWNLLDGSKSLREVATLLEKKYQACPDEIAQDILGIVTELAKRRMLVDAAGA